MGDRWTRWRSRYGRRRQKGGAGPGPRSGDPRASPATPPLPGGRRRCGRIGGRPAWRSGLESPVSTTFQGKGVFPETHPLFLWPGFGDAAPKFVRKVAASCDAVLAIGCRFAEVGTGSYGFEMPGPLVHVDLDPDVFNRNYPAQVTIQADAAEFLRALLAELGEPAREGRPST